CARRPQPHGRNPRLRYAGRPTSLVVDAGSMDFTLAGLLQRRQVARLRVDGGLLVMDRAPREQMTGGGGGGGRAGGEWSVAVVDLAQLGIRLSDLGPPIPDLTPLFPLPLRDLPPWR